MIFIDSHAHIYPDTIALKAAQSIADFYEIDMAADGRLSTLLERGAQAGISKHLVHSVGITPERVRGINDYLMKTVAGFPDRLVGFGTMHPRFAGCARGAQTHQGGRAARGEGASRFSAFLPGR